MKIDGLNEKEKSAERNFHLNMLYHDPKTSILQPKFLTKKNKRNKLNLGSKRKQKFFF
ncbi:MAG: hypothetical protein IC227_02885 [Enterococcus lacertideformus]|uniref:Uncharacterized protein n=1 Tax=Enterococcus lacertideformus TaxID=2771493 RepID=A0A931AY80_9ENTE|nr:hypothetical protein [Enterococcus lacertideformus]